MFTAEPIGPKCWKLVVLDSALKLETEVTVDNSDSSCIQLKGHAQMDEMYTAVVCCAGEHGSEHSCAAVIQIMYGPSDKRIVHSVEIGCQR